MVSTSLEETGMSMVEVLPCMFSHIPVKFKEELMSNAVDVIYNLPHIKPIFVGSCHRPPSANSQYLDNMCDIRLIMYVISTERYILWMI